MKWVYFAIILSLVAFCFLFRPKVREVKDPTAICKDGMYSYSQTRKGTCSGHGGVMNWF